MKYDKIEQKTRIIVKYRENANAFAATVDTIEIMGGDIVHDISSTSSMIVDIPKYKIGKLQLDTNIEYLEVDQEAHILGFPSPMIKPFAEQTPWGITKVKADQVHRLGNTGQGIKVCVIDTGVDTKHEDLKIAGGYDFLTSSPVLIDEHGHGTHVSGTIAAQNNAVGVIGIAPEAEMYMCRVLDANGSGSYSNIIAGIDWAIQNKMQIISMSLGGSGFSQALKDICDTAYNNGIVIIAAAGNSGCGSNDTIGYPAKFDSVIAVGATDESNQKASFSSCGPKLELAAPGVNVLSTVPKGSCKMCDPSGYRQASGTSMATPHVSGVAALIMKAHPTWVNTQVRNILSSTATDLGEQGRDINFGYGLIDALKATGGETPPPNPQPVLLFEDNFDTNTIDANKWNIKNEWQPSNSPVCMLTENVYVDNSNLVIKSRNDGGAPCNIQNSSGYIDTKGKFSRQYFYAEMRAKLPKGKGMWPAFWLLPNSGWPPEIDIIEMLGHEPNKLYFTVHAEGCNDPNCGGYSCCKSGNYKDPSVDYSQDYHIFGMEWTQSYIKWYVDGVERFKSTEYIPTQPMFLVIDTYVGGDWPGNPDNTTVWPQYFKVDYVKVYDKKPDTPTPPPTKKYRCTGSPDFQCVEDPNGPYDTIEKCQADCKQTPPPPTPTKMYRCSPQIVYVCKETKVGGKPLGECQKICDEKNKKQAEVDKIGCCQ